MRNRLNVGVIGLGSMGRNHVRVATMNPFVKDVWVFDIDENAISLACSDYGCIQGRTLEEIFDNCDALIVATHTSSHHKIAMKAISAGKHCLIEKPISETLTQAHEISELSKKVGSVVSIGHIERFNPVFVEVCNILKSEKPYFFTAERLSYNISRANDVSVVLDLMIHDIDAMNYLSGNSAKLMSSVGRSFVSSKLDFVSSFFETEQSCLYNLTASKVSQTRNRKLKISCEDCFVEADFLMRQVIVTRNGSSEYLQRSRQLGYKQQAIIEQVLVPSVEPLMAEQNDFFRSIIQGVMPTVSAHDGLSALKMAIQIEDSLK